MYMDYFCYTFFGIHADIELFDGDDEPPYSEQIRDWWHAVGCRNMDELKEVFAWGDVTHWLEGNVYHVRFNQPVFECAHCRSDAEEKLPIAINEFEYVDWEKEYLETYYYD